MSNDNEILKLKNFLVKESKRVIREEKKYNGLAAAIILTDKQAASILKIIEDLKSKTRQLAKKQESIWRDVSELPEENCELFFEDEWGDAGLGKFHTYNKSFSHLSSYGDRYDPKPKKYCTLTDFINKHNQLLERVRKLEAKND